MKRLSIVMMLSGTALMFLAACGSRGGSSDATVLPTSTIIPTYEYIPPTDAPQVATVAVATLTAEATQNASSLDPAAVEKGRAQYTRLTCDTCHGANGEGTPKGKALTAFAMNENDFLNFLRGGGGIKDHQFSANRITDNSARNLYAFLVSLTQKS